MKAKTCKKGITRVFCLIMAVALIAAALPLTQASAASARAQDIVSTAMQYLGKVPYVWGGTKIDGANPGADCSGFICRIYEKFGFNFWANRTRLINCGQNIGSDLNAALPADIVWFPGHVAIYAGKVNGVHMIVHETTNGGKNNVIYTPASDVKLKINGIARIPGVTQDGGSVRYVYKGTVYGTDSEGLSLNDQPKASWNCTRLGIIPPGATCTVFPDKSVGSWSYVEYNGIYGYASSKYLKITVVSEPIVEEPVEATRQGVVYNVGKIGLAINNKPAASPLLSKKLGSIPKGATCTVYTGKTSGKWYYVEYKGISGYAQSKYIKLKEEETPVAPPAENTRQGLVHDANQKYGLAINDKPASSPKNSKQIGTIYNGSTCTVYTDKTSGKWYYVEYNGVTGWAYSSYITLL